MKAFNGPPWNEQWTSEEALGYLQEQYAQGGVFVVQRLEHEIIGFACGIAASKSTTMRSKIIPLPPDDMFSSQVFYLGEACVPREHSSKGIGTALVSALIEAARQSGFTEGFAVTSKDHTPVERMLRHVHFRHLGSGEIKLGGLPNLVHYYTWPL
jgi:GNAT superfamily N-acetyltransferase